MVDNNTKNKDAAAAIEGMCIDPCMYGRTEVRDS